MARDARIGAIGAEPIRQLYWEGKTDEANQRAKELLKANTTGIALASGAASSSLLADLLTTAGTTVIDTIGDGDSKNLAKNIAKNAIGDLLGFGAGKIVNKYVSSTPLKKQWVLSKKQLDDIDDLEFGSPPHQVKWEETLKDALNKPDAYIPYDFPVEMYDYNPEKAERLWRFMYHDNRISMPEESNPMKMFTSKWYRERLRKMGLLDHEIDFELDNYATNINNAIIVEHPGLLDNYGEYGVSTISSDAPPVIAIDPKTPYRKATLFHEGIHVSEMDNLDYTMSDIIKSNNDSVNLGVGEVDIFGSKINDFTRHYLNDPMEIRARVLAFANTVENQFNGNYEKAYNYYLDILKNNRNIDFNFDIKDLIKYYPKDKVLEAAKKFGVIASPIGIGILSTFPENSSENDYPIYKILTNNPNTFTAQK